MRSANEETLDKKEEELELSLDLRGQETEKETEEELHRSTLVFFHKLESFPPGDMTDLRILDLEVEYLLLQCYP